MCEMCIHRTLEVCIFRVYLNCENVEMFFQNVFEVWKYVPPGYV